MTEIINNPSFLARIYSELSRPVVTSSLDMLQYIREAPLSQYQHFKTYLPVPDVIQKDVYMSIEKRRQAQQDQSSDSEELSTFENLMLFDCLNECISHFKPYGREGRPFPWSQSIRNLRT